MDNQVIYSQLFHELPVLAALLDAHGQFVDVSDKWSRRTGYTKDELKGKSPEDIGRAAKAQRTEGATQSRAPRPQGEVERGWHRRSAADHVVSRVWNKVRDELG